MNLQIGGTIIKEVGKEPYFKVMDIHNLKELQGIVGGYLETVQTPFERVLLVVNEEGLLQQLPINFVYGGQPIVGNVIFIGQGAEDFITLTESQTKEVMEWLGVEEDFDSFTDEFFRKNNIPEDVHKYQDDVSTVLEDIIKGSF